MDETVSRDFLGGCRSWGALPMWGTTTPLLQAQSLDQGLLGQSLLREHIGSARRSLLALGRIQQNELFDPLQFLEQLLDGQIRPPGSGWWSDYAVALPRRKPSTSPRTDTAVHAPASSRPQRVPQAGHSCSRVVLPPLDCAIPPAPDVIVAAESKSARHSDRIISESTVSTLR
jgi:hypothetical protein